MIKDEFWWPSEKRGKKRFGGALKKKKEGLQPLQWSNSILSGEVINHVTLTDTLYYELLLN